MLIATTAVDLEWHRSTAGGGGPNIIPCSPSSQPLIVPHPVRVPGTWRDNSQPSKLSSRAIPITIVAVPGAGRSTRCVAAVLHGRNSDVRGVQMCRRCPRGRLGRDAHDHGGQSRQCDSCAHVRTLSFQICRRPSLEEPSGTHSSHTHPGATRCVTGRGWRQHATLQPAGRTVETRAFRSLGAPASVDNTRVV